MRRDALVDPGFSACEGRSGGGWELCEGGRKKRRLERAEMKAANACSHLCTENTRNH